MKTIFLFLSLICAMEIASVQTEKLINKTAVDNFEKNYNANDFEGVFNLFADIMQKALPIDKTKEFLSQLKTNAGKITKFKVKRLEEVRDCFLFSCYTGYAFVDAQS